MNICGESRQRDSILGLLLLKDCFVYTVRPCFLRATAWKPPPVQLWIITKHLKWKKSSPLSLAGQTTECGFGHFWLLCLKKDLEAKKQSQQLIHSWDLRAASSMQSFLVIFDSFLWHQLTCKGPVWDFALIQSRLHAWNCNLSQLAWDTNSGGESITYEIWSPPFTNPTGHHFNIPLKCFKASLQEPEEFLVFIKACKDI